jgi:hypothetical protein
VFEPAYLDGSLLIVPIDNKSMRENYHTAFVDVLQRRHPTDLPDLLTYMKRINQDTDYPDSLRSALGDAILLFQELQKLSPTKIAGYEQESTHDDQHYALPLFNFPIHTRYPADGLLPIERNYKAFPFLIFCSFQLHETRKRIFTEKYLFTSQEFNIINMLLSGK